MTAARPFGSVPHLDLLGDECLNRIAQCGELAVKEVFGSRKNHELGSGLEAIYPGNRAVDGNDLVAITLDDQPRTGGLTIERDRDSAHGWRNADQSGGLFRDGGSDRNGGAERKTRQPVRNSGISISEPAKRELRILEFSATVVIATLAALGAAKVESQRGKAQRGESSTKRVGHFVMHRAAMQRMRVADDGRANNRGIFR